MIDCKNLLPGCDFLFVVLDSLRYDAAEEALRRGLTPNLAGLLPSGVWEKRHSPGNFTYPAHQAFFAGFLPTQMKPGRHERLFAAAFEGSETTGPGTFTFEEPTIVEALAARNYRTICIGGVGFFNDKTELSRTLGRLFQEHYWQPEFGVTDPNSTANQVDFAIDCLRGIPVEKRVFLFLNVSAIHQPNRIFLPGAESDNVETQMAALRHADEHLIRLIETMNRRSPLLLVVCSDHGTAYGEDGYHGHRLSHPVVWNVPYTETVLPSIKYTSEDFDTFADKGNFVSYAYSYPHKSAYREAEKEHRLTDLWQGENLDRLSLYFHVPFCEQRCHYCNLFSISRPDHELTERYAETLGRQATVYRGELKNFSFAKFAIGGGTPSLLTEKQLTRLFEIAVETLGVELQAIPISFEVSPETTTTAKLDILKRYHVDRISVGVQSFIADERKRLGRPADIQEIGQVLETIRKTGFPTLNVDLIYGIEGQTEESWRQTLQKTIAFEPEEIYLYPLYVREGTCLGNRGFDWPDQRPAFYRQGRDFLREHGYEQCSMRMFKRKGRLHEETEFRCQENGMFGFGCGARSYTKNYHYSFPYSVDRNESIDIVRRYVQMNDDDFGKVRFGYRLNREDQRRRFLILSLLRCEGLSRKDYRVRFGSDAFFDFAELFQLCERKLLEIDNERIRLTDIGLEMSDRIGPFLYSYKVRQWMLQRMWSEER